MRMPFGVVIVSGFGTFDFESVNFRKDPIPITYHALCQIVVDSHSAKKDPFDWNTI